MNNKYFSPLWLYLICAAVFWGAPAVAGQHSDNTEPVPASAQKTDSIAPVKAGLPNLSLEQAVALAIKHNPDLAVSKFSTRMAESETIGASLLPNPELEFEYEDFDAPEKTLTIGYLIELGGKRSHRMNVADADLELAEIELEAARIELIYETASAFVDVLAARENLRIAREKYKLADQVYETAKERVLAGTVSPMEQVTAKVKRSNAGLDVQNAEDALGMARTDLWAMWGGLPDDFKTVKGNFDRIEPVPSYEALAAAMENAPRIRTKYAQIKVSQNQLDLEKRNRIPDLTLSGGIKKTDDTDDEIYIVGLSLPLPLFDRNQAGVARTAAALDRQTAALSAEKNRLTKELNNAFQILKTAHQQTNTIKTEILPAAQSVFDAVREGYQEGEFGFLDLLEAQSTLYESHESHVQSLEKYHHAVISLEKMLGRDLSQSELN